LEIVLIQIEFFSHAGPKCIRETGRDKLEKLQGAENGTGHGGTSALELDSQRSDNSPAGSMALPRTRIPGFDFPLSDTGGIAFFMESTGLK
jgi:hypothetical protein